MVHVVPENDIVTHNTEDQTCICNPDVEFVDGCPDCVVVIHDFIGTEMQIENIEWNIEDYAAIKN